MTTSVAQDVAKSLLDLKAIVLSPQNPFTWASGLRSPIYCDNRLVISSVSTRKQIIAAFVEKIKALPIQPDVIAGCATAGIPHAAWIADRLDLPMIYVRGSEKKHGRRNKIEGSLNAGAKVVVIEDLISTGGSSLEVCQELIEKGSVVLNVLAIFEYQLTKGKENFERAGIPYQTLSNFQTLVEVAQSSGFLSKEDYDLVSNWRKDPQAWSEANASK